MSGDRTAIVTGAARGIGRAISLSLARQGYAIALVDLREKELAETAADFAIQQNAVRLVRV